MGFFRCLCLRLFIHDLSLEPCCHRRRLFFSSFGGGWRKKKKTASSGDTTDAASFLSSATSSPWWVPVLCCSEAGHSATAEELQNVRFCFLVWSSRVSAREWSARWLWAGCWHWGESGSAGLGSGVWPWLDSWWELFSTRIWRPTLQLVPKCVTWLLHDSALHGATEVGRMILRSNCWYWNDGPDVLIWCSTVLTMGSALREANLRGQNAFLDQWFRIWPFAFESWCPCFETWCCVSKRDTMICLRAALALRSEKMLKAKNWRLKSCFFPRKCEISDSRAWIFREGRIGE
jgi:hypothetical protein